MMYFATLPSPVGALTIGADDTGITAIAFPGEMPAAQGAANPSPLIREAVRQLRAYFAGRLANFELPLNPAGTVFQKSVWQALLAVP